MNNSNKYNDLELKNKLNQIVENLKQQAKKNGLKLKNEDIAEVLGYERTYFSTLLGYRGKVTEKHLEHINSKMVELLRKTTNATKENQENKNDSDILSLYRQQIKTQEMIIDCLQDIKISLNILTQNSGDQSQADKQEKLNRDQLLKEAQHPSVQLGKKGSLESNRHGKGK